MNKNSELRLRKPGKRIVDIVREMDSFPKMPKDYQQYSGIGGLGKFSLNFLSVDK